MEPIQNIVQQASIDGIYCAFSQQSVRIGVNNKVSLP